MIRKMTEVWPFIPKDVFKQAQRKKQNQTLINSEEWNS